MSNTNWSFGEVQKSKPFIKKKKEVHVAGVGKRNFKDSKSLQKKQNKFSKNKQTKFSCDIIKRNDCNFMKVYR